MTLRTMTWSLALALGLAACGSDQGTTGGGAAKTSLLAQVVSTSGNTIAFAGNRASYTIAVNGAGFTVTDIVGNGGSLNVTANQRLQFADTNVALDIEGTGGKAYRFYQAAFNRTPDAAGLGYWISVLDSGTTLLAIAPGFLESAEFKQKYGENLSNEALVTAFYANVLHRPLDQGGFDFWIKNLNNGAASRAEELVSFSESGENKSQVLAVIQSGISYAPVSRVPANTVPGVPTLTSVTPGNGSAAIAFSAPASNGGIGISSYRARCSGSGASVSVTGATSPITITGLSNGVLYTCSVAATNALGTGADSATATVTPFTVNTVPSAPQIGAATAGNASASIAFGVPASNGGSAITGYSALCTAGATTVSASASTSPINVTNLVNGTLYACTVRAQNAIGTSPASGAVSVTPTAPVVITVPGAPTIGVATAGNASASVAFTAPVSNGGAAITSYSATCSAGASSMSAIGATSPINVTGLTNGNVYNCTVTAANSAGTSAPSAIVKVTPAAGGNGTVTGAIYCPFSASVFNSGLNLNSTVAIACSGTSRTITGNGIPDHLTGTFPNSGNPNTIKAVTVNFTNTLNPAVVSSTGNAVAHILGFANNGVKFDPSTAESYQNAGVWKIEALNQSYFPFGVDSSNAHVQPDGAYHYHGMPEGYITRQAKGTAMTLVGFAVDGFPIYARYGYTSANDATSATKVMTSSYRMKTAPSAGRPSTSSVPMGTFTQDYEYVSGLGDLDECNGRTGVTPEFPSGIYHYYITDAYPYIQRCVKGTPATTGGPQ